MPVSKRPRDSSGRTGRTGFIAARLPFLGIVILGAVCLVVPPSLAADQGEAAESSEQTKAKTGTESTDGREGKPADPAATTATGTDRAKPRAEGAAKSSPASKPRARSATVPRRPRPVPTPGPTPVPVLSFTDDDLLKYREPPPDEEPGEADRGGVEGTTTVPVGDGAPGGAAAPGSAPGAATRPAAADAAKSPAWSAPPLPPPPPPPPSTAVPPMADPLREHHAREADQKRRAAQIESIRAELASIDGRLGYLKQKRQAIVDPLNIMPAGRTEEERQANASLKPKELLDQVDQQIKDLEKQRESVQERLAAIESRFGGGE